MIGMGWSVQSSLPPAVLAARTRTEPRWNGWRDGIDFAPFLIAEQYPFEVGAEGFRFLVPSSQLIGVVCTGRFRTAGAGTRIDRSASPPRSLVVGSSLSVLPVAAVPVIGLGSVNHWIAIGTGIVPVGLVSLMSAFGFWWNAGRVRHRVTEFLTRPDHTGVDAKPDETAGFSWQVEP